MIKSCDFKLKTKLNYQIIPLPYPTLLDEVDRIEKNRVFRRLINIIFKLCLKSNKTVSVKLGYNKHGCNEITAITNNFKLTFVIPNERFS